MKISSGHFSIKLNRCSVCKWKMKGKVRNARDSTSTGLYFNRMLLYLFFYYHSPGFSCFVIINSLQLLPTCLLATMSYSRTTALIQSGPSICSNHNLTELNWIFLPFLSLNISFLGAIARRTNSYQVYFEISSILIQTYTP